MRRKKYYKKYKKKYRKKKKRFARIMRFQKIGYRM